jgi:drug/metabolite transporter (DMT)-like permease
MKRKDALVFLTLSAIWGSSFMFIKLGLEGGLTPLTLVAIRLGLGALVMAALVHRQGLPFPPGKELLPALAFLGFINNAVPFTLITWGEQYISSGLTAILNSTVPLFAVVLSHLFLADERLNRRRVAGVMLGFLGVVFLFAPDLVHVMATVRGRLAGQLAIILASAGYAMGSVFTRRRLQGVPAAVLAASQLGFAFLWMVVPALVWEQPWRLRPDGMAWFAVVWLGVLGSGVAYFLFFLLIKAIGATPTTMVTYVIPLFAVVFGLVILREPLHWSYGAAMGLIFAGVGLANRRG